MASLKVAIVGAGTVGKTLGGQLLKHKAASVKYGTRDPTSDKSKLLIEEQPSASVDTIQNSVAWADAVVLSTPGSVGVDEVSAMLLPAIKGKVLLDAVNPLSPWPGLEVNWGGKSFGEQLSEALPETHVFKAFNTLGENLMQVPDGSTIHGQQLSLLYAGPTEGKDIAERVVAGVGFQPQWVGSIRYARNLEAIAELWIHLAVPGLGTADKWGRNFHFQAVRK